MSRKIVGITVGTPISPQAIIEKGLPTITDKDEGKILQVKEGVWSAEELPTYDGEFIVTPAVDNEQTLLTAGKYAEANITVEKIPITSVSNSSGGNTVIIG
jgi:hypothetical protein